MSIKKSRTYRNLTNSDGLNSFRVTVCETDLLVYAEAPSAPLKEIARESVLTCRGFIESYIEQYPEFAKTLRPWHINGPAPAIIKEMAIAGEQAGVGPMAAVAGAVAEKVGRDLLQHTDQVVIENGGDVFIKTDEPVVVGVYAGKSPLSMRVGLTIDSTTKPMAVCTSSGTIGHSLSKGIADAVCVMSDSCILADASATSIGNYIKSKQDIEKAIEFGKTIIGVTGLVIIVDDAVGMWGDIEVAPL